ncbi:MAG: DNA polymerase II [Myxococcales bacterium]|nr:DNA polymerase II [Myxococcales bacterium]
MDPYRGFILQPTYRVRSGVPVVQLYGRLESGEAFLAEDDRFRPYFFIRCADVAARGQIERRDGVRVEETALRDFDGAPVLRVSAGVPSDIPPLRDAVEREGGRAIEADIRFAYRFLIDHGLRASVDIVGEPVASDDGLLRFASPELRPGTSRPKLSTLSIDLETSPDASAIFSIAFVGCGASEVHLVGETAVDGAILYPDERTLLEGAAARLRELDPDILTGWNVVDFDLRTWQARARARRVGCNLGRVNGAPFFQQDAGFTRQSRAMIPGRMVLDAIPLVRDALRLDDYRLETASRAILGRGKLINQDAPDPAAEITRLYREDPAALVRYNREDAQLVLDILDREGLLDLAVERSLLCGMQLDRVGASIASFDLVYLPELRRRGVVAPSVDRSRKSAMVSGGALLDPRPGLFVNIAVFDFKSLYPSLIRTFQLDPLAHARAREEGIDSLEAPNGARFARNDAILPGVIERFMESREEAKRRGDRHADQAIKIMMNAMFGVMGAASCRFFDADVANAITRFGQQTLRWTSDTFDAEGYGVIYGDTDSVFVQLGDGDDSEVLNREADELRERVQEQIVGRIRDEYGVEPMLELELEKIYSRFFLPTVRSGSGGSKKRYAGWRDERLEIVGLESVRRDWPAVAGRLQEGLLERVFTDRELLPFVRDLVAEVRAGDRDAELVYVKRIRKGSVDNYKASSPPHVQAARKLSGRTGPVIRYAITKTGPEPILPGRPLPAVIDHRHYIDKVLRPVADAILSHLGLSFDEALGEPKQLSLL